MGIIDECWKKRTTEKTVDKCAKILTEMAKDAYIGGWIDAQKNIKEAKIDSNQQTLEAIAKLRGAYSKCKSEEDYRCAIGNFLEKMARQHQL